MSYHAAGQVTVKGQAYDVSVDDSVGAWHTWLNGGADHLTEATRDELAEAIARTTRQAVTRVAVPFSMTTSANGSRLVRRGIATGIHSSSRNLLVRWADTGQAEQLRTLNSSAVLGELSTEEAEQWADIQNRQDAIGRERYSFEQAHKIDLTAAVRKALADATGTAS